MYWSYHHLPSGKPAAVTKGLEEDDDDDDDDDVEVEDFFFSVWTTVVVLAILKRSNKIDVIYSMTYLRGYLF